MKGIGICHRGIEDIAALEIKELIGSNAEIHDTALLFDIKTKKDLAKLAYKTQSLIKVLYHLDAVRADKKFDKTIKNIKKSIENTEFGEWLSEKTFKVECKRIGEHDFSGQDIAPAAGELIIKKTNSKVSLEEPEIIVYVYIYEKDCYIGIDFCGFDLSKRDYKVFVHPNSLNSTIAYALVRKAGFKKGSMIDPFSGAGTIPIEAALFANGVSPSHFKKDRFAFHNFMDAELEKFDKKIKSSSKISATDEILKSVKSTKNNAKLAGVEKFISVSKMDIEWLDTKFTENSVDYIITNPPSESKFLDSRQVEKLFKEFFYQSDFIIKKKGKIVLCVQKDKTLKACIDKFKITEEYSVWQKKQELKVLILEKSA